MDCLETQRLISEKLDHVDVDAALLERAKEHSRTCPECSAYVRALLSVSRAPLPQPSDELHSRIMAAVRREAAAAEAAAPEPVASGVTVRPAETSPDEPPKRLGSILRDPVHRQAVIAWGLAAAVVFVAAGIGAVTGVRQMFTPQPNTAQTLASRSSAPGAQMEFDASGAGSAQSDGTNAPAVQAAPSTAASPPRFISVGTTVYRSTGATSALDATALKRVGTSLTALDGQSPPTSREVLALDDRSYVYLSDGTGGYLGFERVTRIYQDRVYALQSGGIPSYGQWPSLPSVVERPKSDDGSPTYALVGNDSRGVAIFGPGGSTAQGILVAPGTNSTDPAAGNPDWTWWAPAE
ncbi:MAG: hypothetical protein CVT67_06040 [Actinobacteria bacterium HGW-Actinobacteria-7]|nr:MAG: hypothetical protein CVT67_06040 [Actinobacteria bacterium HGW-Actinobacteria-7]